MTSASVHPFEHLTPQALLDALDPAGFRGDGRVLQLNSYENRVFQVRLEDASAVVVKFYRPERWTDAQILEEHAFALELTAAEVPVIAPVPMADGQTLAHTVIAGQPFRFAVYASRSGHGPELDDPQTLSWMGRFIGRMHSVGISRAFSARRTLNPSTYGHAARDVIVALGLIPEDLAPAWVRACDAALTVIDDTFSNHPPSLLRVHGDCHPGNILWREQGPHVVDLDDACMGPAVQDLWMLLSGSRPTMQAQLATVLAGYRQFMDFDPRELALIEPLRSLRMIHHSAWLAQRWHDPAFPAAFPWFGSTAYWREQTAQLHEQLQAMSEPPLVLQRLDD